MNLKEKDKQYIAGSYGRFPLEIVKGKGSLCWDESNKEYIDLGAGIAVNAFGFCDDEWTAAVKKQLDTLQHTSNLYYTEPCVTLAEMLCKRSGMSKVFFSNSGAEANECAIKVARQYAASHKGPEYNTIITLENSFHGRTLTTLAATGQDHFHRLFQPLTAGFVHTPANDIDALRRTVAEHKVAAILFECVQGEGGVIPLEPAFVQEMAQLAAQQDILLMVDEVQTGNGRTGTLYAYMQYGITPDVVTTAKGLGGGLPIGATLMSEKVQGVLGFGDHGSTYGGNPVCCAGAYYVLSHINDALLSEVQEKSRYIFEELTGAPGVESVTGLGLMIGIQPSNKTAAEVVAYCIEHGVLCLTAKQKVRLLPALNIPMETLKIAIAVLKAALA